MITSMCIAMTKKHKKVPITGTFDKNDQNTASVPADLNVPSTLGQTKPNPPGSLSDVLKDENPELSIPKEVDKKPHKSSKIKKVVLYIVFVILLISVISFSVTVIRTVQRRGTAVDLNDKSGELTWWGIEDPRVYEEVISLYQQTNPEAKIIYVQQPNNQYVRKLDNAFTKGNGPDMFSFHNSWSRSYASELSTIPQEVVSEDEFKESHYPVISKDLITENGLVGIPLEYDGLTLYINNDIFLTSGKEEPTRWDQLKPLAIELTQRNINGLIAQSGIAMGITENVDHWQEIIALLMYQNGVDPENPVGPDAKTVIDYYNSFQSILVWDGSLPPSTVAFAQGDSAMFFGTSKSARNINFSNEGLNYKSVGLPQVRKDDRLSDDVGYATYWVEGVWSGSAEKGLAFDFLKFISDPINLQKISSKSEEVYGVQKIYPRPEMSKLQINDPLIGTIVSIAPFSESWYLADKTHDEPDGINAQISAIYEELLESAGSLGIIDQIAKDLVGSLNQVIVFFTTPQE
ncbi:ABC transporter substrate-binding protein [Patescibacteria group bacterium]